MNKHHFLDGTIYHKRLEPTIHEFQYKFFMLDIDIATLKSLSRNFLCSYNRFNILSFFSKDHFGKNRHFIDNIEELLNTYNIEKTSHIRFITLPRIFGFVFNPISILILIENKIPKFMFVEVHNYNGGRVMYPIKLEEKGQNRYGGSTLKDMYVSPFFKRDGRYEFDVKYTQDSFYLKIKLFENDMEKLVSILNTSMIEFSSKNTLNLLLKYGFLTFLVVIRTIYQSIKLKIKGLKWKQPLPQDQIKRV